MCNKCHNELVEALLTVPDIDNFNTRTALLVGIPDSQSFKRDSSNTSTDLSLLVKALASLTIEPGEKLLKIFVDNTKSRVKTLRLADQLEKLYQQHEQCPLNGQKKTTGPKNPRSSEETDPSHRKRAYSGGERRKFTMPDSDPASKMSLTGCRQKVAEIEHWLAVTTPHKLSVPLLEGYMHIILAAIETLREQAITGQTVKSREVVLIQLLQARNHLSLTIVERAKDFTSRYVNHITSCQQSLRNALEYW